MKEQLTAAAEEGRRSLNAEITSRLEASFMTLKFPAKIAERVKLEAKKYGKPVWDEIADRLRESYEQEDLWKEDKVEDERMAKLEATVEMLVAQLKKDKAKK